MTAKIINGKRKAHDIKEKLKPKIDFLYKRYQIQPCLAAILVGQDPASEIYVRNKRNTAHEMGLKTEFIHLPSHTKEDELIKIIKELNQNADIHGILVQLPLPKHIRSQVILETISPLKDVDGFHPTNVGLLWTHPHQAVQRGTLCCTPYGCLLLLKDELPSLQGKDVVIIGCSQIVGKPMAALMLHEKATVTLTHAQTRNLPEKCRTADIIVVAAGEPHLVKPDWLKPGVIIIDVGINRIEGKIIGDVDYDGAQKIAHAITPVPGGVGPMTIACLIKNLVYATFYQNNIHV